ncbi:hypothetical protein [Oceanospirillum sanctuarii]|uniref:hypothetical protein n=1 Tax=Oceanospirillum sanctuarii TaxID=1434821 RepID=UPI000A3A80EE|nr:hypothetical protein [Oceanospirillum sanctuarii]
MDYSAETLLMRMLEDVSFYLLLITMVLLFVRRNFWISLSAVGMFLYFTPFFMATLFAPLVYKEELAISRDEFVSQLTNGFAAIGILMVAFGFYKLVSEFEKSKSRDR